MGELAPIDAMRARVPPDPAQRTTRVTGPADESVEATPLRLVLGLETSGPGGAEAMVVQLAEALRARGDWVAIATMQPGWMTDRAEAAGIPVWIDPMRNGPDPRWVVRFRKRLLRERIDLLHSHEYEMNVYGGAAARAARLPNVATLHGSVAGTSAKHLLAYRVLGRFGQQLVAVSRDLLDTLSPGVGGSGADVRIIHNGTPVPPHASSDDRRAQQRADRAHIGLPPDGPLFVAVGSLYPVKDHATLLRATASIPDAHLAIAGRGDEEAALRRLADELGCTERVHLLGLRDDIARILSAADVFVQPSLSEGLPLAVLEAMAHQCCVVATDVGGIAEAVVDGESGLLVPPAAPERLAEALRRVTADSALARRLAERAWSRARAEFSVDTMADRYRALYGELLPARRPAGARAAS